MAPCSLDTASSPKGCHSLSFPLHHHTVLRFYFILFFCPLADFVFSKGELKKTLTLLLEVYCIAHCWMSLYEIYIYWRKKRVPFCFMASRAEVFRVLWQMYSIRYRQTYSYFRREEGAFWNFSEIRSDLFLHRGLVWNCTHYHLQETCVNIYLWCLHMHHESNLHGDVLSIIYIYKARRYYTLKGCFES